MNKQYYIALDVHSEKVAIAYTREGSREEATYYGSCGGSVPNTEVTLRRIAKKLGVDFRDLLVCYEAGPTGFVLARRLIHLGLDCIVIAPTKTERKPGERIKTDRRDAQKLAKLFRNGDLTPVRIPPASDEAVRDVCRARTDAVEDLPPLQAGPPLLPAAQRIPPQGHQVERTLLPLPARTGPA